MAPTRCAWQCTRCADDALRQGMSGSWGFQGAPFFGPIWVDVDSHLR
jgi:hypothetical protein